MNKKFFRRFIQLIALFYCSSIFAAINPVVVNVKRITPRLENNIQIGCRVELQVEFKIVNNGQPELSAEVGLVANDNIMGDPIVSGESIDRDPGEDIPASFLLPHTAEEGSLAVIYAKFGGAYYTFDTLNVIAKSAFIFAEQRNGAPSGQAYALARVDNTGQEQSEDSNEASSSWAKGYIFRPCDGESETLRLALAAEGNVEVTLDMDADNSGIVEVGHCQASFDGNLQLGITGSTATIQAKLASPNVDLIEKREVNNEASWTLTGTVDKADKGVITPNIKANTVFAVNQDIVSQTSTVYMDKNEQKDFTFSPSSQTFAWIVYFHANAAASYSGDATRSSVGVNAKATKFEVTGVLK